MTTFRSRGTPPEGVGAVATVSDDPVDRAQPGAPWWRYQRPTVDRGPGSPAQTTSASASAGAAPSRALAPRVVLPEAEADPEKQSFRARDNAFVLPTALGVATLTMAAVIGHAGVSSWGPFLIPIGGLLLAGGLGRLMVDRHPDEPWIGRLLLLGVAAKLITSYFRYFTLVNSYDGKGDASEYDTVGRAFVKFWNGLGPNPELVDLRKTNFLRWFTGAVYYIFGTNFLAGFFVFGLLALIGSYLWFRATADAIPFIDRRLYFALMMFAPSIAFWPSSIGKESLMQLGIGVMALGTASLMRARLRRGLLLCASGGWLLWVVRPHLLAMVAIAGGVGYLVGRVRTKEGKKPSLISRPAGILIVAVLVIFTISQGAKFLGLKDLSVESVQEQLDAQTERSDQGGSKFDNGGNSLSPLRLPQGAVTVLLRPFPWEVDNPLQLLSSFESVLLAAFIVVRVGSIRIALARARTEPFLMYSWVLVILYSMTFSSFANFGLLVRQRSLVLPALYVLLAVDPRAAKRHIDLSDRFDGDRALR